MESKFAKVNVFTSLALILGFLVRSFMYSETSNFWADYFLYACTVAFIAGLVLSNIMNSRNLCLIGLLFMGTAHADELNFGLGVGVGHSAENSSVETKVVSVSRIYDIYDGFYLKGRVGYFSDKSGNPERSSSAFGSLGLGMLVDLKPIEIRTDYGIGAITSPDSYLGGRFPQFQGGLYLGVRDKSGSGIGLSYTHISSAGIFEKNLGRDFMSLEIGKRF